MSKILGIIAEYNPFHNGHKYHLEESKKKSNSDYVVAVITGNYTQRGSCSIINKWQKAKMAKENGIDLIIELPVIYSISSAENFAYGAIKILDSINVSNLSFGVECESLETLSKIANILYNEPSEYKSYLSTELSAGLSFPKARSNALNRYMNSDITKIINSPNNILGIEYLKALKRINSKIEPFIVTRQETNHNDKNIKENFASSSSIRNYINTNTNYDLLKSVMPINSFNILIENINNGTFVNNIYSFEKEIMYVLRKMDIQEIKNLPDVNEGLENGIKKAANSCNNLTDFLSKIKSKRFTLTRIQRILLYSLLDITKNDMQLSKNITPYIHILDFNSKGKKLISEIKKSNPNIITSVKKFKENCKNHNLVHMLEKDILATNIYTLGYKKNSLGNLDYTSHYK